MCNDPPQNPEYEWVKTPRVRAPDDVMLSCMTSCGRINNRENLNGSIMRNDPHNILSIEGKPRCTSRTAVILRISIQITLHQKFNCGSGREPGFSFGSRPTIPQEPIKFESRWGIVRAGCDFAAECPLPQGSNTSGPDDAYSTKYEGSLRRKGRFEARDSQDWVPHGLHRAQ